MKLNKWLVNDVTAQAYKDGKADGECEYTYKLFERLREVDADFISIDHLIEILEQLKSQN